jgi:hypothetical protein
MEDFKDRLKKELEELSVKTGKLYKFIIFNESFITLCEDEKDRLRKQLKLMQQYQDVLHDRIISLPTLNINWQRSCPNKRSE